METKKTISEMTEKEILRKQLELLAERSESMGSSLPEVTNAMIGLTLAVLQLP